MMRLKATLVWMAMLTLGMGAARADFVFTVDQDLTSLLGSGTPPGPFYLGFFLNSGDDGLYNNTASLYDFGYSTNVSLAGAPLVIMGNSSGSIGGNQFSPMVLQEGTTSLPGDVTAVYQPITIGPGATAAIHFKATVTQLFDDTSMMAQPDMFTYQLLYTDGLGAIIPITTDVVPGNIDFVQYSFLPGTNFQDVVSGGPLAGGNAFPEFDGIGPAIIIPEPTTWLIWAATLVAAGAFRQKRRSSDPNAIDVDPPTVRV